MGQAVYESSMKIRDGFVQAFLCLSFQCILSTIFEVDSSCSYKDELTRD